MRNFVQIKVLQFSANREGAKTEKVPATVSLFTQHLIHHLGANALRGKHITLKKQYLLTLPLPQTVVASSPDSLAGLLQRP
jgi:hypothetical protein